MLKNKKGKKNKEIDKLFKTLKDKTTIKIIKK